MKQIIQSYKTGKMILDEVPCPQVMTGMLLIETKASVVSAGTEKMLIDLAKKSLIGKAKDRPDLVKKVIETAKREGIKNTLQKINSKLESPIPLGYSCSGIVKEVGDGIDQFRVADPVACGGAGYANHAEYNVVPKNLCVRIPPDPKNKFRHLAFEKAAFATIGAIAMQGVRQAALTLGENVCVIGLGLLGQLTLQLCRVNGCRVIGADIDTSRIELAKQLGAEAAVQSTNLAQTVKEFTNGIGADAVIITAASQGSQLISLAGEVSRFKGRVIVVGLVGMNVPRGIYYKKELDLRLSMSYGPGRYDAEYEERGHDYPLPYVRWTEQRNMQEFLRLVINDKVNVDFLITHRFNFNEALNAYSLIVGNKEPYLGVILNYPSPLKTSKISISNRSGTFKSQKIILGTIGAGNFARGVLLPAFSRIPEVKFQGVTTGSGMTAKAVAKQFQFAYCAQSSAEILNDESVNTVLIATRHNLHGPLVEQALKAGKHIFSEKPLCLNTEQLQKILNQYNNYTRKSQLPVLMLGFNRRFSPFIQKAYSVFKYRSAPLVLTYRVNAGFVAKDSWIQDPIEGGGRIVGEICHFIDTFRFLTGASVETIHAASIRTEEVTLTNRDSIVITLTYADGSLGTIIYHALGNSRYPKEQLEIAGAGTTVFIDDYRRLAIYGKQKERVKKKQDKGFVAEINAFINAILKGGPQPIPFSELVETTEVTFAIHRSLVTGQVISLADFLAEQNIPGIS